MSSGTFLAVVLVPQGFLLAPALPPEELVERLWVLRRLVAGGVKT